MTPTRIVNIEARNKPAGSKRDNRSHPMVKRRAESDEAGAPSRSSPDSALALLERANWATLDPTALAAVTMPSPIGSSVLRVELTLAVVGKRTVGLPIFAVATIPLPPVMSGQGASAVGLGED
jgi:hypothetical protein